jgi:hypothetical protein
MPELVAAHARTNPNVARYCRIVCGASSSKTATAASTIAATNATVASQVPGLDEVRDVEVAADVHTRQQGRDHPAGQTRAEQLPKQQHPLDVGFRIVPLPRLGTRTDQQALLFVVPQ